MANPLESFLDKKRVLILFDQSRSSATLDQQINQLRDRRPDVSDRDMLVIVNAGDRDAALAMGYADLPADAARQMRRIYNPSPRGLTIILIGKDGTEKQRWQRVIDPQIIFDTIDAMPMRLREMREDG